MNQLSEKLIALRVKFNYSQQYLADTLGISQAAYSKRERGKTEYSLTFLQSIAGIYSIPLVNLLDMTVEELIGESE